MSGGGGREDRSASGGGMLTGFLPPLIKRLLRIWSFEVPNDAGLRIVVSRKRIRAYDGPQLRYSLPIERGSRPTKSGAAAVGGSLYYGDYWGNPERVPANIYRVDLATGRREVFYRFDWVRHIHFVQPDRYGGPGDGDGADIGKDAVPGEADNAGSAGALLIGTGDYDEESGIYRLDLASKKLETIGLGSQTYRAVSLLQYEDALIWGTDDPDGRNFIYRYDKGSGELTRLHELDGPAYYSARDARGRLYIATTIEDRSRHRALVYRSADGGRSWHEYREFVKDSWPTKYFGHGIVEFVDGQEEREELRYVLHGGLREKGRNRTDSGRGGLRGNHRGLQEKHGGSGSPSAGGGETQDQAVHQDQAVQEAEPAGAVSAPDTQTPDTQSAESFRPIFIVGVGRSGTSLLQSMLNAHGDIAFPPETHFIRNYIGKKMSWQGARRKIPDDPYLQNLGLDLRRLLDESSKPVDFYRRAMRRYAEGKDKAFVGDKDPKNLEHLKTLRRYFPGALVIHVYRDPRAVVASRLKAEWSKDSPLWQHILAYKAQWGYMTDHAGLFGGDYIAVKYEELVSRPKDELRRILEKLGLEFEERMLEFFRSSDEVVKGEEMNWKENLYHPVMTENIDKWRRELSEQQRRRIESALDPEMARCGYEIRYVSLLRRLSFAALARLYRMLRCR